MKFVALLAILFLVPFINCATYSWNLLTPTGDSLLPVDDPSAVLMEDGCIYVFGGQTTNFSSETETSYNSLFRYNPATNVVTELHPSGDLPPPRAFHMSWADGNKLYIFAGVNYTYFYTSVNFYNDLWEYNTASNHWTQLTLTGASFPPSALHIYGQAPGNKVFIFGGVDSTFTALDSTWELKYNSREMTLLTISGTVPPPTYNAHHALSYPGIFFGGGVNTAQVIYEDQWTFSFETLTYTQLPASVHNPTNRTHQIFGKIGNVFISAKGDTTGGVDCPNVVYAQNPLNDTWTYNLPNHGWSEVFPTGPAFHNKVGASVTAACGTILYTFGGYNFDPNTCGQVYNTGVISLTCTGC
jgi:hypothetical protein